MAQTNYKFRIVKGTGGDIIGNTSTALYDGSCLLIDPSGAIYLGNGTPGPVLLADRKNYFHTPIYSSSTDTISALKIANGQGVNGMYIPYCTSTNDGIISKADASDGTINSSTTDWVLTSKNGSIGWYKLPSTAFDSSVILSTGDEFWFAHSDLYNNNISSPVTWTFFYANTTMTGSEAKSEKGLLLLSPARLPLCDSSNYGDTIYSYQIVTNEAGNYLHIGDYNEIEKTRLYGVAEKAKKVKILGTATSAYYPILFTKTFNTSTTTAVDASIFVDSGTTASGSTQSGIRYNPSGNTCYCSGGFYEASDERLKNFENEIEIDLDKISKLPKKYFTWKSDANKQLHIGTSAQELQKLYPQLVDKLEDDTLIVNYDKLSIIALKCIDVLNDKIKSLEERLDKFEKNN